MASSTLKFDSIGLAGYAVGVLQINASNLRWSPRHADDAPTKDVELDSVMRAAWTAVGKTCHVRFYCKNGDKLRFDGAWSSLQALLRPRHRPRPHVVSVARPSCPAVIGSGTSAAAHVR